MNLELPIGRHPLLPLSVRGLGFDAGSAPLLRDVSFTLSPGPRTIVLGPNGAGKSLLLRLCHGLLAPTAGSIDWAGQAPEQARRLQAMVFQRPVLLRRSLEGNIAHALRVRRVPRAERARRLAESLDLAGLRPLAGRPARVLSAGEQQRLALARAWALRPWVMFLDEPTAALDPSATRKIEDLIMVIAGAGTRIVMTTHDLGQARRLADEVLFLHRGRLLEHTPAEEFFAAPRSPEAAAFIRGDLLW